MKPDNLVKIRDGAKLIFDAVQDELESQAPKGKADVIAFILPDDLKNFMTIETQEKQLIVRPKGFIAPELFSRLSKLVTASHGYYVSQGKASHFVVPKPV